MTNIIFDVILLILLIPLIVFFVYIWKNNVRSFKQKNDTVKFYEEDERYLDSQITNHPWYYSKEEFEKIKTDVLSKQFPI